MLWNFYIIDRNGINHPIEEPVGWDANTIDLSRDEDWHGIFFTDTGGDFKFYGAARDLLKAEYEEYGVQGQMTLVMEEDCGSGFEEFNRGDFMFKNYEYYCGDECYVKIALEASDETMDLRNRINQVVDMDSNIAFDGITTLDTYAALSTSLNLPSKAILLQDKAEWEAIQPQTPSLNAVEPGEFDTSEGNYNVAWFNIVPQFEKTDLSEFGTFATDNSPNTQFVCGACFYDMTKCPALERVVPGNNAFGSLESKMVLFDPDANTALLYNDSTNLNNIDQVQTFNATVNFQASITPVSADIRALYVIVVIKRMDGTFDYLDKVKIINAQWDGTDGGDISSTYWGAPGIYNFSHSGTYSNITLNTGEYLFYAICGLTKFMNTDIALDKDMFTIQFTGGNVLLQALSKTPTNIAKVYCINEVISRVAESITNNKLKAYSEYFGRIDSQPYSTPADGDGSMAVVTDGLRIRNQENRSIAVIDFVTTTLTNVFSLCLQDLWDGLTPIHNIGMGIELDPNRPGYNRLRVENWQYFYNNSVVMSCIDIGNISRKAYEKEIYSTFQFGYQKWEAEEYNGLDEFLTMADYRTTLSEVYNNFVQTSKFIASGYALEVTRRKTNDSTDWRYDNDCFIICVTRYLKTGTASVQFQSFASEIIFNLSAPLDGPPVVGDTIQVLNATINTGVYVIAVVFNDGTVNVGGTYPVKVSIWGILTNETVASGEYVINPKNGFRVEQGNITNPLNILDPASVYNYRISPLRNAMRWMNRIFTSYKQFNSNAQLLFTDGNGNYYAQGEMTSPIARLENGVISESQTINSAIYADSDNAKPITLAERIEFDYPINSRDYKNLQSNPYGLIYFSNDCEEGYGWIDTVSYKPEQGIATFTLIPKMM